MTGSMRLFIAVPLDDAARRALDPADRFVAAIGSFREVGAALRHVTLAFLGETPENRLERVERAVADAIGARGAFSAGMRGLVALPRPQRARTLVVALDGATGLESWMRAVVGALGVPVHAPAPPPLPHITIARSRERGGIRVDLRDAPMLRGAVAVSRVEIVGSTLTPQGPIYSALRAFGLGRPSG